MKPAGSNYVNAGLGMGEVLNMAAEMGAYTLTDRATYGAYKAKTGLAILVEGDKRMFNPYGIIAVNPEKHKGREGADRVDHVGGGAGEDRGVQAGGGTTVFPFG